MAATGAYFSTAVSSPLIRRASPFLGKLNPGRVQSMSPRFAISVDRVPATFLEAEKGITAEVKREERSVVAETGKHLEENEKKQRSGWKDYLEQAEELIVADGGPPRWFSPLECGSRLDKSPLMLFLPGQLSFIIYYLIN
ncbi:hypothetical protein TSUD_324530 [Trifolium subterraneum]|uniref:Uncharacterized protein n=1 Tax=Trifolium subterraneum TaxID=3900 RepID=A0A2Z6NCI5_TRISU|nr:hypothetical protein TSUD_324530 [Trifolium subterraneum]